ncbi:hypothetical protein E2542_SST30881 [Spatholobus suberectus]|nr:hypothetical protein E2542_SST30881 [Spatholobus suberectus]
MPKRNHHDKRRCSFVPKVAALKKPVFRRSATASVSRQNAWQALRKNRLRRSHLHHRGILLVASIKARQEEEEEKTGFGRSP